MVYVYIKELATFLALISVLLAAAQPMVPTVYTGLFVLIMGIVRLLTTYLDPNDARIGRTQVVEQASVPPEA